MMPYFGPFLSIVIPMSESMNHKLSIDMMPGAIMSIKAYSVAIQGYLVQGKHAPRTRAITQPFSTMWSSAYLDCTLPISQHACNEKLQEKG
jgi:hypothetical protein